MVFIFHPFFFAMDDIDLTVIKLGLNSFGASQLVLVAKNLPSKAGDMNLITGLGRSVEKEIVSHSNILAQKIL